MVNAKLTIDQKREIARKYEAKEANMPQLAREYGVSNALVSRTITAYRVGLRVMGTDNRAMGTRARVLYPRLEAWRQANGLSQGEMAKKAGVSTTTLRLAMYGEPSVYGGGRGAGPAKQTIDKLLKLTELTYEEAFESADGMDGN